MTVILTLEGVLKPHEHKETRNILLVIQMKRGSDERAGGPLVANISDGSGGVMAPGLEALASVDDISGSHGSGRGQCAVPRRLLRKVGRNLGV